MEIKSIMEEISDAAFETKQSEYIDDLLAQLHKKLEDIGVL